MKHAPLIIGTIIAMSLVAVAPVSAQQKQILSVTPPLFQLSAVPGQVWQSSIKVVNGNPYPMTVYAEVVNFKAAGESGQGRFVPLVHEDAEKTTLGEWIDISPGPYEIEPERTRDITFIVDIPNDAPPGGHYAAILITTKPPKTDPSQLAVQTSQAVTSLFFVRLEGDVNEAGSIREFRVLDPFVPKPEAEFSVRFENRGNVHLQPRGDIVITNMWGTERGIIPINYDTHFGNVLPESIRDFKFTWQSDLSFTDIGRYKAVVTLGYGEDGIKNISSITFFWVIPVKITLITLLVLALFVALIIWMVKAYIRRMLLLAGVPVDEELPVMKRDEKPAMLLKSAPMTYRKVAAPIRSGVLDLRTKLSTADESSGLLWNIYDFVLQYKRFFLAVMAIIIIVASAIMYINRATAPNEDYRVIIDEGDTETTLTGDDIERVRQD